LGADRSPSPRYDWRWPGPRRAELDTHNLSGADSSHSSRRDPRPERRGAGAAVAVRPGPVGPGPQRWNHVTRKAGDALSQPGLAETTDACGKARTSRPTERPEASTSPKTRGQSDPGSCENRRIPKDRPGRCPAVVWRPSSPRVAPGIALGEPTLSRTNLETTCGERNGRTSSLRRSRRDSEEPPRGAGRNPIPDHDRYASFQSEPYLEPKTVAVRTSRTVERRRGRVSGTWHSKECTLTV
jgi:hypothetical protein